MVYTINNIIEELNNRGYNAQTQVVTKNGIELNSVVIRTEDKNIAPNIYVDFMLEEINEGSIDFDFAISKIIEDYKAHKDVSFDGAVLEDKEFIFSHLYIALQRASTTDIVKKECGFEGIEAYLYIKIEDFEDGLATIKVTSKVLGISKITEEEAWKRAEENTFKETTIKPIFSAINDLLDGAFPVDTFEKESCGLFVLSNKSIYCGASAILDQRALKVLSEKTHTTNFIMIPSSRHEVILLPDLENINLDEITEMVQEVNANEVKPIDQLADKAYRLAI